MRIDHIREAPRPRAPRAGRAAAFSPPADVSAAPEPPEPDFPAPQAAALLPLAPLPLAQLPLAPPPPTHATPDQAASQARALLGALAGLQLASLRGNPDLARQALAELAAAPPTATAPDLDAVLQAIAQRAAIELARPR